jgi:hypothetical protein
MPANCRRTQPTTVDLLPRDFHPSNSALNPTTPDRSATHDKSVPGRRMTQPSSPTVRRAEPSTARPRTQLLPRLLHGLLVGSISLGSLVPALAQSPSISSILLQNNALVISVDAPAGFRHAVLESGGQVLQATRESLAAGALDGRSGLITFTVPDPKTTTFLRIRLGADTAVPAATYTGSQYFSVDYSGGSFGPLTSAEKTGTCSIASPTAPLRTISKPSNPSVSPPSSNSNSHRRRSTKHPTPT